MFTGIIKKTARIKAIEKKGGCLFFDIAKPAGWKIFLGQSLAINGVCSTVKSVSRNNFKVEYMPETIKRTTAGFLKISDKVNLERSLKLNDLVDGHLVQGHIDVVGEIIGRQSAGDSIILKIKLSTEFMKFIASKGSAAVDGISLTVVDVGKDWFTVSLVSYTLENTNLDLIKSGDKVNIETDVIAKYLEKICNVNNKKISPSIGGKLMAAG